ncbi:hypothetical protein MRB53_038210 [Persea americana]|nr:hypothetical protein MRB53_038210 [Persea americana]
MMPMRSEDSKKHLRRSPCLTMIPKCVALLLCHQSFDRCRERATSRVRRSRTRWQCVDLLQHAPRTPLKHQGLERRLLQVEPVKGKCYVLTFSRSHNLTLADLEPAAILPVIKAWTVLYTAHLSPSSVLAKQTRPSTLPPSGPIDDFAKPQAQYRYMQIFENKGAAMGCSNPHPHGQVWTTTGLPEEAKLELEQLMNYHREQGGTHMLEDYATLEATKQERVVFENGTFLALCPWWATWPFEVMIVSKMHKRALVDFDELQQAALAEAIAEVTRRYDNLFETQFPYSTLMPATSLHHAAKFGIGMGVHQAPLEGTPEETEASHFHIHFYPPLLRSATVRKFLVGYELMAEPQRDITPEQAAKRLRDCGDEAPRCHQNGLTKLHGSVHQPFGIEVEASDTISDHGKLVHEAVMYVEGGIEPNDAGQQRPRAEDTSRKLIHGANSASVRLVREFDRDVIAYGIEN